MKKRILSALLTLGMVLTMLPVSVFAADYDNDGDEDVAYADGTYYSTLDAALTAASSSEETEVTITVLESCSIGQSITIPDGKTFTLTAAADDGITITDTGRYGMTANGSLTMENITFITNGRIALNGTPSWWSFWPRDNLP